MMDNKNYWIDEEKYSGVPGSDVHKSMAECFADYYSSGKKHKVTIQLNDVTVTLSRKRF